MRTLRRFARGTILTYFVTGMVYSLTGYVHRAVTGKQEVFSPLIGIPVDVIGWPWMVYADLKHISTIGVKPQPILALISVVVFIFLFARTELLSRRSMSEKVLVMPSVDWAAIFQRGGRISIHSGRGELQGLLMAAQLVCASARTALKAERKDFVSARILFGGSCRLLNRFRRSCWRHRGKMEPMRASTRKGTRVNRSIGGTGVSPCCP